jgi:hypothetical protein
MGFLLPQRSPLGNTFRDHSIFIEQQDLRGEIRRSERMSLYVPEDLAPEVEKALENGRELQALMNEAGTRYLHARKRERRRKAGEK